MTDHLVLVANAKAGTVSTFALTDGTLTPLVVSEAGGPGLPLAVDAARGLVYAGTKAPTASVKTLRLDPATGTLEPLHSIDVPGGLSYLTLTADGSLLLGAAYGGGYGQVWRADEDGSLAAVGDPIEFRNLHCVVTSSDDRFAYFVSLGDDLVAQYALGADGVLTPLDPPTVAAPTGAGARHLVLDAAGANAYVLTEYSGEVLRFARDADSGILSYVNARQAHPGDRGLAHSRFGADPVAGHLIWASDLHLDAAGTTLYTAERCASTVTALPIEADGSVGEALGHTDVVQQPRGFAVLPGGTLLVASEATPVVAQYRPVGDGTLELVAEFAVENGANWVSVLPR